MTRSRNFRVLSALVVHKNPHMTVRKQMISYPDNSVYPYFILDRNNDFSVVIPIFPDKSTILVGQYRVPIARYSWEFPMGIVKGATPLGSAKKELVEETGYTAKKWEKIGRVYIAPGFCSQWANVFIARDLTVGKPQPEEHEIITLKKAPLTRVKQFIKDGTIKDGPTIMAFYLLEQANL